MKVGNNKGASSNQLKSSLPEKEAAGNGEPEKAWADNFRSWKGYAWKRHEVKSSLPDDIYLKR